jgi:hypothetical protein
MMAKDSNVREGQMIAPTADDLEIHARTLSQAASAILLGLANGKYGGQMEVTEQLLKDLAVVFPPAADVEKALEVFLFLNKLTTPAAGPDGHVMFMPSSNARYDQKTADFV